MCAVRRARIAYSAALAAVCLAALACGRGERSAPAAKTPDLVQAALKSGPVLRVESREFTNDDLAAYVKLTGGNEAGRLSAESLSRIFDRFVDDRIRDEIRDRFGPVPATIENLLRYGAIKHLARRLRIRSIDRSDGRVVFRFLPGTSVDWGRVPPLLKRYSGSLSPQAVMSLALGGDGESGLLDETVRVLKELSA